MDKTYAVTQVEQLKAIMGKPLILIHNRSQEIYPAMLQSAEIIDMLGSRPGIKISYFKGDRWSDMIASLGILGIDDKATSDRGEEQVYTIKYIKQVRD